MPFFKDMTSGQLTHHLNAFLLDQLRDLNQRVGRFIVESIDKIDE